ncbi:MAG: hypothetical protein ACE5EG_10105 [Thermoanaerobaculia bacterium]
MSDLPEAVGVVTSRSSPPRTAANPPAWWLHSRRTPSESRAPVNGAGSGGSSLPNLSFAGGR